MKKHLFFAGVLCLLGSLTMGQEIEIKEISGNGQKKFKKAPKRAYIAQFRVMYQLLFSQTETAQGGREIGGGYRGDATVGLTMAVQGVSPQHLRDMTNTLYQDYTKRLTDAGFELVAPNEAQGTKTYEGWEIKHGGTINEAQFPGYLTVVPDGYDYLVKGTTNSGREKSTFYDNSHKLSADLKGAVVIKVNLVVPFVVDAESGASKALTKSVGGVAKIVVKPDLRIEKESVGTAGGGFNTDAAQTKVSYVYGLRRIGPEATSYIQLKKDIDIPGVLEEKKYKAAESAQTDNWGSNVGAVTLFNVSDSYLSRTHPVPCDPDAYQHGVLQAGQGFFNLTLDSFLGYAAGKK